MDVWTGMLRRRTKMMRPKTKPKSADHQAAQEQGAAADAAQEGGAAEIGKLEIGFAGLFLRHQGRGERQNEERD